jgi:hypothetical protein
VREIAKAGTHAGPNIAICTIHDSEIEEPLPLKSFSYEQLESDHRVHDTGDVEENASDHGNDMGNEELRGNTSSVSSITHLPETKRRVGNLSELDREFVRKLW